MAPLDDEATRTKRERWWRSGFFILATIYVGLLLLGLLLESLAGFGQIVLVVFVAWLLAFVLSPVVTWLQARFGVPRGIAIGITYAVTLLVGGGFLFYAVAAIGGDMGRMADEFPLTRARIEGTLLGWQETISIGRFEPHLVALYRDVEATLSRVVGATLTEVPEVTVAVLGSLVLVIILSLYMLADSAGLISRSRRIVPNRYADEFDILERTVSRAFGGFLRAQVILVAVQTVLTLAVVVLVGLPYGFFITATSALAMVIPFFGPPLALVPPILATAIFASPWVLLVAPLLLIVQTVLVNYLQPRLMQEALGMHPLLVLIGLLVGAQVAGLWGALFGIPVIAVLNVFFNYVVNLRTLEESTAVELDEVLEEVREEAPEATTDELVALAAERVAEAEEEAEAEAEARAVEDREAAETDAVSDDLKAAAGDLRAAAGEQRAAAGEIGESAAELRDAADRLGEDR